MNSNDAMYSAITSNQNGGTKGMRIKSIGGIKFKLTQFKHYNWGESSTTTMTVKGYRNSVEVASTTFEAFIPTYLPFDVVLGNGFDNVDDVRFYITAGGYVGDQSATNISINNIVIADAVPSAPTATTDTATSITTTSATLNGTVNDKGASTTVTFDYGLTNAYGSSAAATTGGTVGAGAGATAASVAISSLTCNTTYHFRVKGVNSEGTTNGSDATFTTNQCPQTITFNNPGTQSFGTTPTLPATSTSGLAPTFTTTTAGVCTISTGGVLTTVTTGTCTINANQAGDATYAAAPQVQQSFMIAAVSPGTPTIGTATAGDAQASVTFTAPASNGGSPITTYTATAIPDGATGSCAGPGACTITVLGLTNGTAYTFTVTAANAVNTGSASAASNSVTPKAAQAISFNNPGTQNFGTPLTLTATATSALIPTFTTATAGVCTITPGGTLTFVTAGSCTISANQAGNGSFNAAPQVQQTFTVNAVAPGTPTIGTATAGDTQASVTFTTPASNGGSPITTYTATAIPGGATGSCAGPGACTITVLGLTNGTAYTFTVTAANAVNTGSASAASNSVTPKAAQAISFNNPGTQNFGTIPTLAASATSSLSVTFTSTTTGVCTVAPGGALTFVTVGLCTINADQAGNASYLAAPQVSQSFTVAATVPGAPTIGVATAGNAQVSVSFTAPAVSGGAPITSYTVTSAPGGITATGAASPIVVPGLTNGTSYTFTVTANNSVGASAASAASAAVTPQLLTVSGTVPGMVGTATATLSGGGSSCTLNPTSGFASLSNPAPAGKTLPYGEYAFQSTSCVGTVTMAITYPEALPAGIQFWKYGPATPAVGGVVAASSWFQFSGASLSGDRKTVTYSITDNGVGDSDGAVGSISDPFAPVVGPVASDAVAIPVDAPWALALLSAMIGLMGWHRQRQRARN
ncbi:IPTL-CTERM sorting domain-containing protein [Acidovorax sp. 69]|uniref:beta strand repeat-containing protein n=1 Tax=Acidovorax sp. 69 TaxID=2035202 RepID=UPI001E4B2FEF|nr:IPTL-CTERM sorting domain-containing protein [Acidovorax sp. 69]